MLENVTIKVLSLDLDKFHIIVTDAEDEMASSIQQAVSKVPGMKGIILKSTKGTEINVASLTENQLAELKKAIIDATYQPVQSTSGISKCNRTSDVRSKGQRP